MRGLLVIILTTAAMGWLAAQARHTKAQATADGYLFPVVRGVKVVYCAVLLMGIALALGGYFGSHGSETTVICIGLLFVVFALVTYPKAIYVSDEGIKQRSWRGQWKALYWSNMSEVIHGSDGAWRFQEKSGATIEFSQYHADCDLFIKQVRIKTHGRFPHTISKTQ